MGYNHYFATTTSVVYTAVVLFLNAFSLHFYLKRPPDCTRGHQMKLEFKNF